MHCLLSKDFKKLKEIADRRDYLRVLSLTSTLTLACFRFISQVNTTQQNTTHAATTNKTTEDKRT
jgi:hypothetical protein